MIIGCVKEIKKNEFRVGLTPDSVSSYVKAGHQVYMESQAGIGSGFSDQSYVDAGATIFQNKDDVWQQSDMIVKVKEPLEEEYQYFRKGLIIYTYLHLAANEQLTRELMKKEVTTIAYETIELEDHSLPCLLPMSQVAGRLAAIQAVKCLEKEQGGMGILVSGLAGVPKAEAVVIGAGIVGINALDMLVGMGANVTVLDVDIKRLQELEHHYNNKIETLMSNETNLINVLKNADIIISGVLLKGAKAPKLIKRSYYAIMKKGAVIVDVAIDQGGSTEVSRPTTHDNPTYEVDGIIHYMVANIPGAVPKTATIALNYATLYYGLLVANLGVDEAIKRSKPLNKGLNTYQGKCVYQAVIDAFEL